MACDAHCAAYGMVVVSQLTLAFILIVDMIEFSNAEDTPPAFAIVSFVLFALVFCAGCYVLYQGECEIVQGTGGTGYGAAIIIIAIIQFVSIANGKTLAVLLTPLIFLVTGVLVIFAERSDPR